MIITSSSSSTTIVVVGITSVIVMTCVIVIVLSVSSVSCSASLADCCVFFASSIVSLIRSRIRAWRLCENSDICRACLNSFFRSHLSIA